jgi:glutamyl-tRNA(Gln) amidotransferase subunit E
MNFDPKSNYEKTKKNTGYVPRREANQKLYDKLGFMSGLEVHQQLLTKEKLFCHCPSGIYNKDEDYDAELIRHMRPTLSELGEYDGTALMEFKTRKEIVYRINNDNACTYEIDDTPPFPLNREALEIALEISLLSKLNIVGEVHITRKQYLDGSIPTGFQRTAILGVEGSFELPHKTIRLIQLSIEEDSCREISDIGHRRVYKTDRLGMPLIETVTYPDCTNPGEVKQACDYIRFLNRSTGKVRTGMGAARQDVNVSCKGGTRVEIKGVAHTKWIPELTHNEMFRQWALLLIRDELNRRMKSENWKTKHVDIKGKIDHPLFAGAQKVIAVKLTGFKGILSHFTQPGKMFADEIADRLKVIACLERPNMLHSESFERAFDEEESKKIARILNVTGDDAWLVIWGSDDDMPTALETIDERCKMAFEGVPKETRKSFEDGTTIFERVLPGADRMYPDTDSAPIPLDDEYIESLKKNLPDDIIERYKTLKKWGVPEDVYTFIFSKNLFPLMQQIVEETGINPAYLGIFFGEKLKFAVNHYKTAPGFRFKIVGALFRFLKDKNLQPKLAELMLPVLVVHPKMEFESILTTIGFRRYTEKELLDRVPLLKVKFANGKKEVDKEKMLRWIMGQLRKPATGNVDLTLFSKKVKQIIA